MARSFNPRGFYLERHGQGVLKNKAIGFAKSTSIIGRDEKVEVVLVSRVISRQHCKIEFDSDGRMFIEDLKSANGTFLNGIKIVQRTEMEDGDLIGIGFNNENEKFSNQAEYFVYNVKLGTVVTLSSDEDDDINEFFKSLNQEQGMPMGYNQAEEVISLSEEETEIDKEWRKKLKKLPHAVRECSVVLEYLPIAFKEEVIKKSRQQIAKERQNEKYQTGRKKTSKKEVKQEGTEKNMRQLLSIVDSDSDEEPKQNPSRDVTKKHLARKSIPQNTAMRTSVFDQKFEKLKAQRKRSESSLIDTEDQRKHTASLHTFPNEAKKIKKRRMTISLDYREVKDNEVSPSTLNIRRNKVETAIKLELPKELKSTQTKIRKRRMTINNDYESVEKIHNKFIKNGSNTGTSRDLKRSQSPVESSVKVRQLQEIFYPNQYENPALGNTKSRECADRAREARQEKLRELSEKQKAIEEQKRIIEVEKLKIAKEKSISTGKVKLTEKNRGDFLTALQPIPKFCKKSAVNQLPTTNKKEVNKSLASDSSMFEDFRRKNVKQKVNSTTIGVDGVSMHTVFETIDYKKVTKDSKDQEVKNDRAKIEAEEKCRTDRHALPTIAGFYNPINFSQPTVADAPISQAFRANFPEENIPRKLPIVTFPASSDQFIKNTFQSSFNIKGVLTTPKEKILNAFLNEQRLPRKTILTLPLDRLTRKKSVRFNEILTQVKVYERDCEFSEELNPPKPKISIEQYMLKTRKNSAADAASNHSFSTFIDFILKLTVKELAMDEPNTSRIKPKVVKTLEDYKSAMMLKLKTELKLKIWKSMKTKTDFMNVAIAEKKTNEFGRIELTLSSKNIVNVLPRSFIHFKYKINEDSEEQDFFGFVSKVLQLKFYVEAEVPCENFNDVAVLKGRTVLKNCNDVKSFVALSNIEDSPLMSEIIDPLKMNISDDGNYQLSEIYTDPPLKPDQEKCIRQIASKAAGLVIIKGAPATGKTKVLVASVVEIFKKAQRYQMRPPNVLICCPHEGSVENVALSILEHVTSLGVKLLHVGKVIGVLGEFSLRNQAKKAEDEQDQDDDGRFEDVRPSIVARANIIVATTLSSYDLRNMGKKIDICFIDNVSECTETELLIPLHLNFSKLVLIGDQFALKDSLIARAIAAFEKDGKKKLPFLNCQFRCNKDIYKYVNDKFYNGLIANDVTVITRKPIKPYMIFDLKKDFCFEKHLAETIWRITQKPLSIAILSTCLQYNGFIKESLEWCDHFKICTLESIQGLEVDVLIVSIATDMGVLDNLQALHTVLARAKQGLYICGNFSNLKINENWKKILEDAKERNFFYTINNDEIDFIPMLQKA